MGKTLCDMYAQVNGEISTLHKNLLKKIPNRPLANLIYASYLQLGVADLMNNLGYPTNKQGLHDAKDVMEFLKVAEILNKVSKLSEIEVTIGAKDKKMNFIDYTNAKDAIDAAVAANSNYEGITAYVVKKGDVYNIITEEKTSNNVMRKLEALKQQSSWNILEHAFSNANININDLNLYYPIFNALESKNVINWLNNLRLTRNNLFTQNEIRAILSLDENSSQVNRLKNIFGDLDTVAEKIYDAFHYGGNNYTSSLKLLMNAAIDNCKKLLGIDLTALTQQINQNNLDIAENSNEGKVYKTLEELNKEYGINKEEVHSIDRKIHSLSDAANEALATLKREMDNLRREEGVTDTVKDILDNIIRLTREIENKKYYAGVMGFLSKTAKQFNRIDLLHEDAINVTGTTLEKCKSRANSIMEIKNIRDGYEYIIDALMDIDNLRIDTTISAEDLKTIKELAEQLKYILNKYKLKIGDLELVTMIDIVTEYVGNTTVNCLAVANIVKMGQLDGTMFDKFYSIGKVSNPLIATMGSIIRDALNDRNKKLNDVSIRIKRATNKLFKSGSNTDFMYESINGMYYIISDIDWNKYHKARSTAYKKFVYSGLRGLELAEAMQYWEEANTEDRQVDFANKRNERVPNQAYRKAFPTLTPEQLEYYNTMMQLKGELGTLLPEYALKHYLPPQMRRSVIDAITKDYKHPKRIIKAILSNIKEKFVMSQDDPLDHRNGIIGGLEYGIRDGALDNTVYKLIPIFFINKLRNQEELLKDFSGAMQSFAGTAINYECMNNIQNIVEFMGNYITNQNPAANENGTRQAQIIAKTKKATYFKDLFKRARNTNNEDLIHGFIDLHLYGMSLKDVNKWTRLMQSLIGYTSSTLLSVNVRGALSNVVASEYLILMEAGAGEFFNLVDFTKAHNQLFTRDSGELLDSLTNNENSMAGLLAIRFDPQLDKFRELSDKRYYTGVGRRLISKDYTFIGYGAGEHVVRTVVMYSILNHTKVVVDGKKVSLDKAFKKVTVDGVSELQIIPGAMYKNKEGNLVPVDDAFLDEIRDRIRYCGQSCFGSMNDEDKGIIHRTMTGRLIMQLKQWMIEHYSRRYRTTHWDATLKQEREGYYYTALRLFRGLINNYIKKELDNALKFSQMNEMEKANAKRFAFEFAVVIALFLMPNEWLVPEDEDEELERMAKYLAKRGEHEIVLATPIGLMMNGVDMTQNLIAVATTIKNLTYPVAGLYEGHHNEEISKGRYKGWNKYARYMLKYTVPYYNQMDQYTHFLDEKGMFLAFDYTAR